MHEVMDPEENLAVTPPVLLFDGDCGFCNRSVNFILERERSPLMQFAPIQSKIGSQLLRRFGIEKPAMDTVYVIANGELLCRSTAALWIAGTLREPWCWTCVLLLLPRPLRDLPYRLISRLRQQLSGKLKICQFRPDQQHRFLV